VAGSHGAFTQKLHFKMLKNFKKKVSDISMFFEHTKNCEKHSTFVYVVKKFYFSTEFYLLTHAKIMRFS
jgi:hypothetical protein